MQKPRCEELSEQYPDTVILQLRGGFYNAFDDSAVVLASVMGYKVKAMESGRFKSGFPVNSMDKVAADLKLRHISFIILDGNNESNRLLFENSRFKDFYDASIVPVAEEAKKDSLSSPEKVDVESNMGVVRFIELLCEGKDPYTGNMVEALPLNDIRTVRMFYQIRDLIRNRNS